ncbi:retron Ec67 family RNA-directed DNA polymerase/endonuclease [Burkholderia lata]|uniref:retron Ec67 family RNA-directed DNA polymerase/endonuclease n=1 Tax=Burkholderia lata (strain ATCC 17760 / DSM 23089 / LMG 22485 / NCIMB 9086 / R18194 / 383) TaxID=482957 RepID=UPI001452D0E8|nr:retron Ec67 family RNA-directed DNA polymerase/endonuclease [Burkholderia lata]VWL97055.1 reverse transcriptase [Burkholderia lata]
MSRLAKLRGAAGIDELADLLGFKPKAISYILYIKDPAKKYTKFDVPKRGGGNRTISAPYDDLMNLQRRLAELLQECISEINGERKVKAVLSHGFRPKQCIKTNAWQHRKKRFVFNIDLQDFFGSINYGRVRGFFITNKNFKLTEKVATLIAQIACHDNVLPQGSPCSPVISNLIGHLLDIRLAELAKKNGCTYSRYADDITFSTNKPEFPRNVAVQRDEDDHDWVAGADLVKIINKSGFKINDKKTRLQYHGSRQEVTGLVVNRKLSARSEYRHVARAMVHRLMKTGAFVRTAFVQDKDGKVSLAKPAGTIPHLNGILSFIDSVDLYNRRSLLKVAERDKALVSLKDLSATERCYRDFLFYKNFLGNAKPMVVCEGKTDNIYIQCALRSLLAGYPSLIKKGVSGYEMELSLFNRTQTTDRLMSLSGGSEQFKTFVREYLNARRKYPINGKVPPIIIVADSDDGVKNFNSYIGGITGAPVDMKADFTYVKENLYVVYTPLGATGKGAPIEDMFDKSVLQKQLNGKTFNPSNSGINHATEYGKAFFAQHVVKKGAEGIDFSGFKVLLDRIVKAVEHSSK